MESIPTLDEAWALVVQCGQAMRLAPLGLLVLLALSADDYPKYLVPNQPDLTIRTRRTFGGAGGASELHTLWFKGARSRQERSYHSPYTPEQGSGGAWISQCDAHRMLLLNPDAKTYGYIPIRRPVGLPSKAVLADRPIRKDASGPEVPMTIDAVDTGERRRMAGLTARHVVTTTTTGPGGDYSDVDTRVQDGWYVDLPPMDCQDWGAANATLIATVSAAGANRPRFRVTQLGTARRGFPLIETDRSVNDQRTFTGSTELIEISDRTLDPALFDVPADYRPALPTGDGNFDMTRPDTVTNRVRFFWESATVWFHRIWW